MSTKTALIIKIIFAVLIIFIVVEVVLGLRNLNKPGLLAPQTASSLQPISGGKVALQADKTKYKPGENINVAVRIFTGGNNTDGTDLIIGYDSNMLEVATASVTKGSIYGDYPLISVSGGKIAISGISIDSTFNGVGVLANLNFTAKQTGQTTLSVDYTAGKTTDSNIIETGSGKDILDQVTNLELIIDNSGGAVVGGSCSERIYTQCTDASGKSGSFWCSPITDGFSCTVGCFKEKTGNDLGCKVI